MLWVGQAYTICVLRRPVMISAWHLGWNCYTNKLMSDNEPIVTLTKNNNITV